MISYNFKSAVYDDTKKFWFLHVSSVFDLGATGFTYVLHCNEVEFVETVHSQIKFICNSVNNLFYTEKTVKYEAGEISEAEFNSLQEYLLI